MSKKQKLSKALLALMMTASMVNYAQIPTFAAENTGNQILVREVTENDGATLTVDGKTYNLLDFEFDKRLTISPNTKDLSIHISGTLGGENVVRGELSGFRKTSPGGSAFLIYRIDKKSGDSSIDINVKVEDIRENVRYTVTPYGPYNYIMLQSYIHSFHFKFAEPDQAPIIEINDITIEQESDYSSRAGLKVSDDHTSEADLLKTLEITGADKVNTNVPGEYKVTYKVIDNAGNFAEKTIKVTVTPIAQPTKVTVVINGQTLDVMNGIQYNEVIKIDPNTEELVFHVEGSKIIRSEVFSKDHFDILKDARDGEKLDITLAKDQIIDGAKYIVTVYDFPSHAYRQNTFVIEFDNEKPIDPEKPVFQQIQMMDMKVMY